MKKMVKSWVTYDKDELEKLISKLAKESHSSSKIGMILRDQYGIPSTRVMNVRVQKVVSKYIKSDVPDDMFDLLAKAVNLHNHTTSNKKDNKSRHDLASVESRIRRLAKYYKKTGKIPNTWEYTINKAKLLVK
ncbi:MAG: 30S ribosomal protein S15 [Candidatus Aenigmatarchaeota archaeon]